MNFLASLNDHVGKLVDPATQAKPVEFARHKTFLSTRLAISLAALIIGPIYLVMGGAPAWWEAAALGWLLLPVAVVAYVSRTGHLALGEAFSLAIWIGLSLTLTLGSGSDTGLALLLLVPLEVAVASGSVASFAALALAFLIAACFAFVAPLALGPVASGHFVFGNSIVVATVGYAGMLSIMTRQMQKLQQHQGWLGQERYRVLSEAIDDVVLRFDSTGSLLFASAAVDRLFAIKPRELLGRGFFEHIHVADRPGFLKLVTDAQMGPVDLKARLRIRTGKTLPSDRGAFDEPVFAWVELRAGRYDVVEDARENAHRGVVVALMKDVTTRILHEQALDEAKKTAERSTAGRDLFLANVSHELRTPLNAIIGFAEMLSNEQMAPRDPAKQREYATIIHQSGQHLLSVVNSILDASKIESGSFDIVPEAFDLGELIHTCSDMVGLKAQQAGIELVRDVGAGLKNVIGDKRAYKQIVINLLSNALKFTPSEGRVVIGARPDGNSLLLSVADTGIGIVAGDLPRLGDPFFQARSSYDRAYDGTGLGLSVVRGLVGLHGGAIAIESAPGQGTCVTVRLPLDCRRMVLVPNAVTKIETIPRYPSHPKLAAGASDFARAHKIA